MHVLLGDFGLAQNIADHVISFDHLHHPKPSNFLNEDVPMMDSNYAFDDLNTSSSQQQQGTYLYLAPEILASSNQLKCTAKSDMYSLGIILFELFHPFETGMERVVVLNQLRENQFYNDGLIPDDIWDLICNLVNHDPVNLPFFSIDNIPNNFIFV